jgi:putative acetyltransferase
MAGPRRPPQVKLTIRQETPRQDGVRDLLRLSDGYSEARYPADSRHGSDLDTLCASGTRFFVARIDDRTAGCAALVIAETGHAEIKRMIVDPRARRCGVGTALLNALEEAALYRRRGFCEREPFGAYRHDPLSVFMEKEIAARKARSGNRCP